MLRLRLPLRARWTAALLLASALPLGVFAAASVRIQRNGLELAEKELEVSILDRVAGVLDRDLDAAAEATHRVGRVLTESAVTDDEARLTLAREALARAGALAHVAVYTPAGAWVDTIAYAGAAAAPAAPPSLAPELVAAAPEAGAWLPAEFGPWGVALRYAEPVRRDAVVRAWVVGTLPPRLLPDELADISLARFGHPDRVLLVDLRLRLLAGGARPPGVSMAGQDIFARASLPADTLTNTLGSTTEFAGPGGEAMIGTLRTLPERHWAVVVRRPEREAFAALDASRRLLARAVVACAVLGVALGAWLAARTTRPIRALTALTRAYAERRFAERSTVRTGDELEDLGESLTAMADRLAAGEVAAQRHARVEADFARYLPAEVARAVASGERALALGGARRGVSVLFADVVAFTAFAERAAPERVVAFLNELFTVLTEVVFRHGGMVDKFVGDCVMAVFGASGEDSGTQAARALAAAEDMHRFVEAAAPAWRETYGIEARLGIGVNTGEALVGNLGSEARMEYTAIGDVVNVAARLEALAAAGQTLVTAAVAVAAGEGFAFRPLGTHPLRGKREPVEILELLA